MFARIGLPVVSMRVVQLVRLPKMSVRVYRSAVHSQTYRKHIARTSARHVARIMACRALSAQPKSSVRTSDGFVLPWALYV